MRGGSVRSALLRGTVWIALAGSSVGGVGTAWAQWTPSDPPPASSVGADGRVGSEVPDPAPASQGARGAEVALTLGIARIPGAGAPAGEPGALPAADRTRPAFAAAFGFVPRAVGVTADLVTSAGDTSSASHARVAVSLALRPFAARPPSDAWTRRALASLTFSAGPAAVLVTYRGYQDTVLALATALQADLPLTGAAARNAFGLRLAARRVWGGQTSLNGRALETPTYELSCGPVVRF